MKSFGDGYTAMVVGASGGLGHAFVEALLEDPALRGLLACSRADPCLSHPKAAWQQMDLEDEASIATAAEAAESVLGPLHLVIVASGLLHDGAGLQPEKTWRSLEAEALERSYRVNAVGPALLAKHLLPRLDRSRKSAFAVVTARVGSISDNQLGGWYAYRASKAAANMLVRTLSIELARRNPGALCVALHPGTVDTPLSRPFQRGVPEGKLFSPAKSARHLLDVLDRLGADDSGQLYAWDGQRIPF
ncbi:MAG: SDR family NAD(P)-dependent oxidoreductase [Kiloniellales bacterium]|nr:SDR family NAD(P)-dependent oxidoreductase [Kiloniellales bacterium]